MSAVKAIVTMVFTVENICDSNDGMTDEEIKSYVKDRIFEGDISPFDDEKITIPNINLFYKE